MGKLKKFLNAKKALKQVKQIVGTNTANALSAMQHTADCEVCGPKLNAIIMHCNASQNTKFGLVKIMKHLPKCDECKKLFIEITEHAGTKVNVNNLSVVGDAD